MPNIKPISDLRNYTEVLKEVSMNNPVYLTRNGRDEYAIVRSADLDKLHAIVKLLSNIQEGEKSAREGDWLSADAVEAALGL